MRIFTAFAFVLSLIFSAPVAVAQVSIQTDGSNPDGSAMLDVKSTSRGALVPRMTFAQRNAIVSPANSLLIYQEDNTPGYYYYDLPNTTWHRLFAGSGTPVTGSGVANQVTFWSGPNSLTGSGNFIYDPTGNLSVYNAESSGGEVRLGAAWGRPGVFSSNGLHLFSGTTQPIFFGNDNVEYMRLTSSGNLAIGNTAGSHQLHVGAATSDGQAVTVRGYSNSPINWKGGAAFGYTSASVIMGELSGVAHLGGHNGDLSAWADLALNFGGGNVGIGTASPGQKLDVAGNVNAQHLVQGPLLARPMVTWSAAGNSTGAVIIKLPGGIANYGMLHIQVDVYEYGTPGATTYLLGGHNWNGQWYNYSCTTIGKATKKVRLAVKDGQYAIVLGETGSSWSYGHVVLSKITTGGYYSGIMNLAAAYSITQDNSAESYTWITTDLNNNVLTVNNAASLFPNINGDNLGNHTATTTLNMNSQDINNVGDIFAVQNYGKGLVGVYSDVRYQNVFAMGAAYRLAADGTTPGNMYGLAWTHSNMGGQSRPGLGHQLLAMSAGVTTAAMGNGFWTNYGIETGASGTYNTFHTWTNLPNHAGLYSSNHNGAHFYPNNGSYGAWRIDGKRGGWGGIEFSDPAGTGNLTLMMNYDGYGWGNQQTGVHHNTNGWLWYFAHQQLYASGITDINDGNYYVDPNGNSVINTVRVAGGSPAVGKVLTSTDGAGNATWEYPSNPWENMGTNVHLICAGGAAATDYEWGVTYNNDSPILRVTCNRWNTGQRICTYPPYPTGDSQPFTWGGACWLYGTSSTWDDGCSGNGTAYHSYYYQDGNGKYFMAAGNGCGSLPTVYRRRL